MNLLTITVDCRHHIDTGNLMSLMLVHQISSGQGGLPGALTEQAEQVQQTDAARPKDKARPDVTSFCCLSTPL